MTGENEQIELTPAKESPWVRFLWSMAELDETREHPNGWCWLIGLHYLLGITIKRMQDNLPDDHPLKSAPLPEVGEELLLKQIISELKERLGNPKKITEIDFSNLEFKNFVNFSNLIFPINVTFSNSKFYERIEFNYTEFFISANFNGTCFSSTVQFYKARLSLGEFQKTVFNGFANFSDTTFIKLVDFKEAVFSNQARFNNAKFLGYTTFENAIFELNAPKFYGAELNDEMFWTDIKLPKFEKMDDETEERYKKRIKDNENAYENLSTKLGNQKKYRDELFFFRQELSCQRKLAESITSGFAFRLYELFSGYGYNIGRAFWCWVGHMVLGVLVIAFISMCSGVRFHESLTCAIPVSIANANPYVFFGFESSSLTACYKELDKLASISFAAVKAIQTVIGIALLSLLITTLRIRFRLK